MLLLRNKKLTISTLLGAALAISACGELPFLPGEEEEENKSDVSSNDDLENTPKIAPDKIADMMYFLADKLLRPEGGDESKDGPGEEPQDPQAPTLLDHEAGEPGDGQVQEDGGMDPFPCFKDEPVNGNTERLSAEFSKDITACMAEKMSNDEFTLTSAKVTAKWVFECNGDFSSLNGKGLGETFEQLKPICENSQTRGEYKSFKLEMSGTVSGPEGEMKVSGTVFEKTSDGDAPCQWKFSDSGEQLNGNCTFVFADQKRDEKGEFVEEEEQTSESASLLEGHEEGSHEEGGHEEGGHEKGDPENVYFELTRAI